MIFLRIGAWNGNVICVEHLRLGQFTVRDGLLQNAAHLLGGRVCHLDDPLQPQIISSLEINVFGNLSCSDTNRGMANLFQRFGNGARDKEQDHGEHKDCPTVRQENSDAIILQLLDLIIRPALQTDVSNSGAFFEAGVTGKTALFCRDGRQAHYVGCSIRGLTQFKKCILGRFDFCNLISGDLGSQNALVGRIRNLAIRVQKIQPFGHSQRRDTIQDILQTGHIASEHG